jgi:ubiquinone/menaquinone biosynthesis C-methylase UbiE
MRKFHKRYFFLLHELKRIQPIDGLVIVDCACGQGDGLRMFTDHKCKLFGVDIDSKKISYAKSQIKDAVFCKSSIEKLPFENNFADIFICSETMEHLPKTQNNEIANEIKRVTKQDGIICVTVPANRKTCLKKKGHKQYLSIKDVKDSFLCDTLFEGIFIKNPKNKTTGNFVIIMRKK